ANHGDILIDTLDESTDWSAALTDVDTVIHLANRAHTHDQDEAAFFRVNVGGTVHLARQASLAGVRRFIFLSSLHVNGEVTSHPFTEASSPAPNSPYARSKWEAEQALLALRDRMEIVIVRPPLVYGAGVKANFLRL